MVGKARLGCEAVERAGLAEDEAFVGVRWSREQGSVRARLVGSVSIKQSLSFNGLRYKGKTEKRYVYQLRASIAACSNSPTCYIPQIIKIQIVKRLKCISDNQFLFQKHFLRRP